MLTGENKRSRIGILPIAWISSPGTGQQGHVLLNGISLTDARLCSPRPISPRARISLRLTFFDRIGISKEEEFRGRVKTAARVGTSYSIRVRLTPLNVDDHPYTIGWLEKHPARSAPPHVDPVVT
ncbi:MAG: hypothetical protein A2V83_06575 [Nitrospirae bacterium RBG_16_64_22]|nr:MAG: hypothetical protein A2V83_06575 [Nitrospirae bacterium RBG_16_64_22]